MKLVKNYRYLKFSKKKVNEVYSIEISEYNKIQIFNNDQLTRYGYYRRCDFKKDKIKKIMTICNPLLKNINSSDPLIIGLKCLLKSFVGELIEICRKIMYEKKDSTQWNNSPVHSAHLNEVLSRFFEIKNEFKSFF
nr:transcription initiation factor IID SU beta [Cryptomonas paramecium]